MKASCSHNTCSRILFYLDVGGGKRIRCPGASSGRFLVTHGPPKAVRVNKTLVPTTVVPLLRACRMIFDGLASLPRNTLRSASCCVNGIFRLVKKQRVFKGLKDSCLTIWTSQDSIFRSGAFDCCISFTWRSEFLRDCGILCEYCAYSLLCKISATTKNS